MEPILLNTETDKSGEKINIFHTERLALSPVYTFFLRQIADLIDAKHALAKTTWVDANCGAVYAEKDGKILGHIVYSTEYVKSKNSLWIELSAVDQQYRGRGIYTILHQYFELIAKQLGCSTIASQVHKNNTVRLESAEKVGMKKTFYQMVKIL